ncbi:type IV conjugative transfer system protein TraL [Vibrio mediterranei]|uniref:Type IV conjugative transfer system protein TraL n=1 Tax=Vibrio mediterranei TaxID=689 RepID=A0ABX5D669_9VIBR|nr:type IV conjugative transfer system protein TraL [Vibrio mediterranei]MCG9658653.1 type IV conjugative transfer system protein TraL [Vibrio mediterranei]PRQ65170.1 type IV conjugative transfer system protein TraL [Vibrio mediterranei]
MSVENPEQYLVPERLDEPYRFMIFTPEEAVAVFAPALIGYTFDLWMQGLGLGVLLFLGLRKLRGGNEDFLNYCKYWVFPDYASGLKYTPSSTIRTFYS